MYLKKLPEDAKQIKNAKEYIDKSGNIYGIENRNNNPHKGEFFKKAQQTVYGYKYVSITYNNGQRVTKRVHRLVAETFIDNPDNFPIVMHINNKKHDNRVENLKWGTISENTQQAFNDGLITNDKGFEDSQSIQCDCYKTIDNSFYGSFGSVTIAAEKTGITVGGVLYQIKNPEAPIRKNFYFTLAGFGPISHDIIIAFDYESDVEVARYVNIGAAAKETGISDSSISSQVNKNEKPMWVKDKIYFRRIKI